MQGIRQRKAQHYVPHGAGLNALCILHVTLENNLHNDTFTLHQGEKNVFFAIVVLLAALHPLSENEAGSVR